MTSFSKCAFAALVFSGIWASGFAGPCFSKEKKSQDIPKVPQEISDLVNLYKFTYQPSISDADIWRMIGNFLLFMDVGARDGDLINSFAIKKFIERENFSLKQFMDDLVKTAFNLEPLGYDFRVSFLLGDFYGHREFVPLTDYVTVELHKMYVREVVPKLDKSTPVNNLELSLAQSTFDDAVEKFKKDWPLDRHFRVVLGEYILGQIIESRKEEPQRS
ncbi:hypothetical protein HOD08_04735 [bacterium]|nr:hypothetical protein [bacterium]